jgi:hypothetical protein
MSSDPTATGRVRAHRFHVALLISCGIVAAAQVGKAIITIPLIRSELAIGLDIAG